MCRTGGRRCPGHDQTAARDAHNRRRRENRKIKAGVVGWAQAQGIDSAEVRRLEAAGPRAVKDWAQARGLDPRGFLTSGAPAPVPPAPAAVPAGFVVGPGRPHPAAQAGAAGANAPRAPRAPQVSAGRSPAGGGSPAWMREAWATSDLVSQVQAVQALQGSDRDERNLLHSAAASQSRARGGTNETNRVELSNGTVAYHKPFHGLQDRLAAVFGQHSAQQPVHEAAAWQLARQMGPPWSDIVPPCVIREVNGRLGSFALERPGREGKAFDGSPEWRAAAFFDALLGQQDRHKGNYLLAGDRLTLIDHGYAFARPGDITNHSVIQRARAGQHLDDNERGALRSLLRSPDLFGLDKVLEPARAEALRERARAMLVFDTIPMVGAY